MKISHLTGILLAAISGLSVQQAAAQALDLSLYTTNNTGFYTNTFDSLGYSTNETVDGNVPNGFNGGYLSSEWICFTNASVNNRGTIAAGAPSPTTGGIMDTWTDPFIGQFKNYASYFDYLGGTNFYTNGFPVRTNFNYGVITNGFYQTNEPNRCLGIRQIGAFGDPGAAFTIVLADTANYDNFKLSVDLMNLDPTSPRETTWHLQYGIADPTIGVPASFQDIPGLNSIFANAPGSNHVKQIHNLSVANGTINNIGQPVYIRIATLTSSTIPNGSGNRETFAIDNFGLTWQVGNPGCTPLVTNPPITITPPTPPVYDNATVSFSVNAAGSQPIYYQWRFNGTDISAVFPSQVVGYSYRSATLTLNNVSAANEGTYDCIVSNICGSTVYSALSPTAVLSVSPVPVVSLGYLRTLTDPNNTYAPTVSPSQLYQVTGIITTFTNLTSANTSSYYLEDGTGGMNLFVTGGRDAGFRPALGDEVTAIGYLNLFQDNLELEADYTGGNNATSATILSNNIPNYPVAKLLNWTTNAGGEFGLAGGIIVTNQMVEQGNTNSDSGSKKGSICMLTNVYFGTNAGHLITGNYYAFVTNSAGVGGYVYFWADQDPDVVSNTIPAFAYSVQGPLFANIVSGGGSFWSGIAVTKWSDVVTNPVVLAVTRSGNSSTITWTAAPLTYSYSVLASVNAAGPYTPIATNLNFPDNNGNYTDVDATTHKFYKVTSP